MLDAIPLSDDDGHTIIMFYFTVTLSPQIVQRGELLLEGGVGFLVRPISGFWRPLLRNVGDATARSFNVVAGSDDPGVELSTPDTPFAPMHTPSSVRGKAIREKLPMYQWAAFTYHPHVMPALLTPK